MTSGNRKAHEELGDIIERLRRLEENYKISKELHAFYYDRALYLLTELEAALSSETLPTAIIAQKLQFPADIIAELKSLQRVEQSDRLTLGPMFYLNQAVTILPQATMQAAQKFKLDAIAIYSAAEPIIKYWAKWGRGYRANLPRLIGFIIRHIPQADNIIYQTITSAYNDVIRQESPEKAYSHLIHKVQEMRPAFENWYLYTGDTYFHFTFLIRPFEEAAGVQSRRSGLTLPATAEEKIAYSLIGNATLDMVVLYCKR